VSSLGDRPRVLYFCSRLPSTIQNGLDLRVRGQMTALLEFCELAVFALNGKGLKFDDRITSWRSSDNPDVSKVIDTTVGMAVLKGGGHPFSPRFSEETASELSEEIRSFRPSHIVISRIDLTVYLEVIKREFDGVIILDLDESAASTGPSILKVLNNPGQALVFRTLSERVAALELEVLPEVDQVWVSSEVERQRVISIAQSESKSSPSLLLVPNCVLVEDYSKGSSNDRAGDTIIFPASFAYEPSLDAARFLIDEVMPLLPEITLLLVGSHIPLWMTNLDRANIRCEGPVASMVPYLHSSSATVIPLRAGGGTRLKAIESMATGIPVISTSFGVEGLGLTPGTDYLEAHTTEEFASHIRSVLSNQNLSRNLASNGRAIVAERFSTQSLETRLRDYLSFGKTARITPDSSGKAGELP